MTRFNTKWGAAFLIGFAALYMVLSLATGRSATSKDPANLAASEMSLGVWKACALLVRERGHVLVVDISSKRHFDVYHLPGALHIEASNAKTVADAADGKDHILLVADQEKDAMCLAAELLRLGKRHVHILKDGSRSWYLTFELPVPLYSDRPPPDCSCQAMVVVRDWLHNQDSQAPDDVLTALGQLSRMGYEPSLLELRTPTTPASSTQKTLSEQFRWMDL